MRKDFRFLSRQRPALDGPYLPARVHNGSERSENKDACDPLETTWREEVNLQATSQAESLYYHWKYQAFYFSRLRKNRFITHTTHHFNQDNNIICLTSGSKLSGNLLFPPYSVPKRAPRWFGFFWGLLCRFNETFELTSFRLLKSVHIPAISL